MTDPPSLLGWVFGRHALAWTSIGAAWTVWVLGVVLGVGEPYWAGLGATSTLWLATSAIDRLERYGGIGASLALVARAACFGAVVAWLPMLALTMLDFLPIWITAGVAASAVYLVAPLLGTRSERADLWRTWSALKHAAAASGGLIFVVMLAGSVASRWGIGVTPAAFVSLITLALACVAPTVLSWTSVRTPPPVPSPHATDRHRVLSR